MDGLPKLEAGHLVTLSTQELRKLGINEVRSLMHELGLNVEGIVEANQGLTRLFENALSIEDVEE